MTGKEACSLESGKNKHKKIFLKKPMHRHGKPVKLCAAGGRSFPASSLWTMAGQLPFCSQASSEGVRTKNFLPEMDCKNSKKIFPTACPFENAGFRLPVPPHLRCLNTASFSPSGAPASILSLPNRKERKKAQAASPNGKNVSSSSRAQLAGRKAHGSQTQSDFPRMPRQKDPLSGKGPAFAGTRL